MVNGKGENLIRFLDDAQIPKDKGPSLLARGSLCNAIRRGKGHSLLVCLEQNRVPIEKWHTVLSNDSLCSAIASGGPVDLACFSTEQEAGMKATLTDTLRVVSKNESSY